MARGRYRITSILAATDFSPDAQHAVERAARLAVDLQVRKTLLLHIAGHSWLENLDRFLIGAAEIEKSAIAGGERALRDAARRLGRKYGCNLDLEVRVGKIVDCILAAAADYDLVILGARGRHRIRELTVGTTGHRLLRKIRKPVLLVRNKGVTPIPWLRTPAPPLPR